MPRRHLRLTHTRSFLLGLISSLIAIFLLALLPMPYVVYKPGAAQATGPMVSVGGEQSDEEGEFLLTTVNVTFANMLAYVSAGLNPHAQLFRKEDILRGNSKSEYTSRQQFTMRASQSNAIEAAYRAADVPYDVKNTAILVTSTVEDMGAEGVLLPGDELLSLNGKEIREADDVTKAIQDISVGQEVAVTFKRGDRTHQENITLEWLPDVEPQRPGIGISYAVLQQIASVDPKQQVDITVDNIGGPSAGLMFALEIVNRLTEGDITKGRTIAGTGEIEPDGKVKAIGGVRHKVVAADRQGADVFFAPTSNAAEAELKARDIGSDMAVVSVATIQDALNYLKSLKPVLETAPGG